jgi:hypothetical protein
MWESHGLVLEVAMYVRSLVAAEKPSAPVAARTLLLRHQDTLGLTIAGLRMNRWIIIDDEQPGDEARAVSPRRTPRGGTARTRLLGVIDGGA